MNTNKIASRVAKSEDVGEISEEFQHWAGYLDETLQGAQALIGKLSVLRDFLNKAGNDPTDRWRRVVALAIEAKDEIPNDGFVQEASFMRSKMREWTQKPFYTISPSLVDQQKMDPATKRQILEAAAQDSEAINEMARELSQSLKEFHSHW